MSPDNRTPKTRSLKLGRPKGDFPRRINLHISEHHYSLLKACRSELGISANEYLRDALEIAYGGRQRHQGHPNLENKLSDALRIFMQDRVLRYSQTNLIKQKLEEVARIHGPLPFASFDAKLSDDADQTLDAILAVVAAYLVVNAKTNRISSPGESSK